MTVWCMVMVIVGYMHHKMNYDDEEIVETYEARRVCQVLNVNDCQCLWLICCFFIVWLCRVSYFAMN